jgi:hypothetical protein
MKIISGGQTGSDIAGLIAAKKFGLETGGWMPKNCITEIGPKPEYLKLYNMTESTGGYVERTIQNIQDADMTFIFAVDFSSEGTKLTLEKCIEYQKLYQMINVTRKFSNHHYRYLIANICSLIIIANTFNDDDEKVSIINIAGNRQSKGGSQYDIQNFVIKYMSEVFIKLGYYNRDLRIN